MYLKNNGKTAIANDISIQAINLDTCCQVGYYSDPNYGDIPPGEVAEPSQEIHILFSENCPDSTFAQIKVDIYSDTYIFWNDTFSVFVHKDPLGLAKNDENIPLEFALKQNYPNPFNPSTSIEFSLPKPEYVELKVYNIIGEQVVTLVSNKLNSGNHTYQFDGKNLASGVYYYQLTAGEYREVKKMILLR